MCDCESQAIGWRVLMKDLACGDGRFLFSILYNEIVLGSEHLPSQSVASFQVPKS